MSRDGRSGSRQARRWAIVAGVAAVILVVGGLFDLRAAFVAYLTAWLFVLGLCAGAMVMRMVHVLTGGRWGEAARPALVALAGALPVVALAVVPLLFGLHELFEWARPEAVAASDLLQKKAAYLNVPFFVARTVVALGLWSVLAWRIVALDGPLDDRDAARMARLRSTSIAGLMLYAVSVTWFGVDWIMSLQPEWKSTVFGLLLALGQTLGGFAAALTATAWQSQGRDPRADPQTLNDLGNVALTLVLTWAYLAFMQYLIVWIGDKPHHISWYLPRLQTSWKALAILLVATHFAAPFLVLLFRSAKRSAIVTTLLGVGLLVAHWLDVVWLVVPGFRREGFALHWVDFAALVALAAGLAAWIRARAGRTARGRLALREARGHG